MIDPRDLQEWEVEEPPADFAERVVAQATRDRAKRSRRAGVVVALVVGVTAAAAAVMWWRSSWAGFEQVVAVDRSQVQIGRRGVAVLEKGASIQWKGHRVSQAQGDVFYRVEPGGSFEVQTPAGLVSVEGTCFRVKVSAIGQQEGSTMTRRDVVAGVAGAAVGAVVLVGVYEGKVRVSRASDQVVVSAGHSAVAGPKGVRTVEGLEASEDALRAAAEPSGFAEANRNLVDSIATLHRKLDAVEKQKEDLTQQLRDARRELEVASRDGAAGPPKHDYDLSQSDWQELAKNGSVKYRTPCFRKGWQPNAEWLHRMGMAPGDAAVIGDAYARSNARLWNVIRPLCAQLVGSTDVAEKIGPDTCVHLVTDMSRQQDSQQAQEAMRQVGEMRAGMRQSPGQGDHHAGMYEMFMALTGEEQAFEADLAQAFGPQEAHRIAFAEGLCVSQSHFGGAGPRGK